MPDENSIRYSERENTQFNLCVKFLFSKEKYRYADKEKVVSYNFSVHFILIVFLQFLTLVCTEF